MFGNSDAMGMSIAIGEAADLAEQERIAMQLAIEDDESDDEIDADE